MYKLVIIALLVNLGLCQEFIKESNMWQLDKDSFWKVASRMEVHSVIELYSSDSWCGKFSARPWIWTPCIWNSFSILDDMLCETCVVFSKLLFGPFGPWIRRPLICSQCEFNMKWITYKISHQNSPLGFCQYSLEWSHWFWHYGIFAPKF